MIRSFADRDTQRLARREPVRRFAAIERAALIKLRYLEAAPRLDDLRLPPGNRLEALKGDRKGQYAIRINRQWRICFRWKDGDVWDVEIVDCHD
jgi:proteic killer suppression protein